MVCDQIRPGTVIGLMTKSPAPVKGRVGPKERQDWYQSCLMAMEELHRALRTEEESCVVSNLIVVPSAVTMADSLPEAAIYFHTLVKELGIPEIFVDTPKVGHETIGQIEYLMRYLDEGYKVHLVCTALHLPRVWWLSRKYGERVSFGCTIRGIPRPTEAVTDIVMAVVFPIIDLLGYRSRFQQRVITQRLQGNLFWRLWKL